MAKYTRKRKGMTPERARRAAEVLRYREAGLGFEYIADRLGIAVSTAHGDYRDAIRETFREDAESLAAIEGKRLDRLQAAHWVKAVEGNVKATEVVLKVMERRARLFGLDRPQKVDLSASDVDLDSTVARILDAATVVLGDDGEPVTREGGAG